MNLFSQEMPNSVTLDLFWAEDTNPISATSSTHSSVPRLFRRYQRRKAFRACPAEVLELRQLLTGPPQGQPANVDQAYSMITSYASEKVVLFESIKTQLLERPLEQTPTLMKDQLQNTVTVLNNVLSAAGGTGDGGSVAGAIQASMGTSQTLITSFGANINENSPEKHASLHQSFTAGTPITLLGVPVQTNWAVSGDLGTAFVSSSSVDLTSTIDFTMPNLPAGAEDRIRQTVEWHKSPLNPGSVDLGVLKHKKSSDGLSELFVDIKFKTDSGMSDSIEGIFRQRDGYWLREVEFKAIDDDVTTATSRLAYLGDSRRIDLSFSKNLGITGQSVPEWHGRFDGTEEVLGQTAKIIATADRIGEGTAEDLLVRAGAGMQRDLIPGLSPGWVIAATGKGHKPGESGHTWGEVSLLQPIFVGTPNETYLGVAYQYVDGNPTQTSWTTNLFTSRDRWSIIFGVQQAHDNNPMSTIVIIPPLLP